jgi:hypothetical protein
MEDDGIVLTKCESLTPEIGDIQTARIGESEFRGKYANIARLSFAHKENKAGVPHHSEFYS